MNKTTTGDGATTDGARTQNPLATLQLPSGGDKNNPKVEMAIKVVGNDKLRTKFV